MKVLVVLSLMAVLCEATTPYLQAKSISYPAKKLYYRAFYTCILESKIGRSHLENLSESGDLPDDPKLKKFFSCIFQETGAMDKSGEFRLREGSKEKMAQFVGDVEKVERIVGECMVKKGSPEDTAIEFARCKKRIYPDHMLGFVGRVPDELYDQWKLYKFECSTGDTLNDLNNGIFPETPEFKNYILCISKKFGFQDKQGKLNKNQINKTVSEIFWRPSRVNKLSEKCLTERETPQDTALLVMRCYYDNTFVFYDESVKKLFVTAHEVCRKKSKISFEQIQELKAGQYPNDPEIKEHLLCLYKKIGVMDEDLVKKLPLVVMYGKFREVQMVQDAVIKCDVTKETPQDTAYELFVCLNKNLRNVCNMFKYF